MQYAPLISTFGALALPTLVVVFTAQKDLRPHELSLTTGLLVIGLFGGLIGAFSMAAVGSETDPTANIAPSIMYAALPASAAFLGALGAFEVLASVYVPQSSLPFLFIVGAGSVYGVLLTAMVLGDAPTLHPRTLQPAEFDRWLESQWLKSRRHAYKAANRLIVVGVIPPVSAFIARLAGLGVPLTTVLVNVVIYVGVCLCLLGAIASAIRTIHPPTGNHQSGLRRGEAWAATMLVSLYSSFVLLLLPT